MNLSRTLRFFNELKMRLLIISICLLASLSGFAQASVTRLDTLLLENDTLFMRCRVATTAEELRAMVVNGDAFPVVVLRRSVYDETLGLIRRQHQLSVRQASLGRELQGTISLMEEQVTALRNIAFLEQQRADNFRQAADGLISESTRINNEIAASAREIRQNTRGMGRRNLFYGLLGGAVGLAAGTLIGVLAQ
jgi:hypothetical protein